jgi:hypothetical protein
MAYRGSARRHHRPAHREDRGHGATPPSTRSINKLTGIDDPVARERRHAELRGLHNDIDVLRLASELVADDVVEPGELRAELVKWFTAAAGKDRCPPAAATAVRRSNGGRP